MICEIEIGSAELKYNSYYAQLHALILDWIQPMRVLTVSTI